MKSLTTAGSEGIQSAREQYQQTGIIPVEVRQGNEVEIIQFKPAAVRNRAKPNPSPFLEAMTGYVVLQTENQVLAEKVERRKKQARDSAARKRKEKRREYNDYQRDLMEKRRSKQQ